MKMESPEFFDQEGISGWMSLPKELFSFLTDSKSYLNLRRTCKGLLVKMAWKTKTEAVIDLLHDCYRIGKTVGLLCEGNDYLEFVMGVCDLLCAKRKTEWGVDNRDGFYPKIWARSLHIGDPITNYRDGQYKVGRYKTGTYGTGQDTGVSLVGRSVLMLNGPRKWGIASRVDTIAQKRCGVRMMICPKRNTTDVDPDRFTLFVTTKPIVSKTGTIIHISE